jgi:hypothetical protein
MSNSVFLTQHNGIDVHVTPNGEFCATVQEQRLRAPSLGMLQAKIEEEMKQVAKAKKIALDVVALMATDVNGITEHYVQRLTVIGLNRNDSTFRYAEDFAAARSHVVFAVPHTLANEMYIYELMHAKNNSERLERLLKPRTIAEGGRIPASKYPEELLSLETRYARAVAQGVEASNMD